MKYKCNECGAEMIDKSKGPYIHLICPKCGNELATYDYTKDDPIKFDETIYTINSSNNQATNETIKVISKISGINYVNCKKTIEMNGMIISGKAIEIIEVLKVLKENNIIVEITPAFPYKY